MKHKECVLVVDDEKTVRTVVAEALEARGWRVATAASPTEALRAFEQSPFALALVDLNMPGSMDGIALLTEIHRRWPQTMIIILTGYGTLDSAINALRQGVCDYLTKPASMAQIVASVERALAKYREQLRHPKWATSPERANGGSQSETARAPAADAAQRERFAQTGRLTIDRQKRLVIQEGKLLDLTATEFDYLDYLVSHSDRVITAQELICGVQGYADMLEVDARPIVRVHIQRLRQKLGDDPENPRYVQNVRGKGYRFTD